MGATKLLTAAGGGITLDAASTATDKTITIPADNGTLVYSNSSGNVGIGTSSPSYKMHVYDGTSASIVASTPSSDVQIAASSSGFGLIGTVGNYPLVMRTNGTERARIDSSGYLRLNNTDGGNYLFKIKFDGSSQEGIGLQSSYSGAGNMLRFINSAGTSVGVVSTNNTTTTYGTSSDYRLKENIAPMTGALSVVAALNPVTYTWKGDGSDGQGFIAHELQAVVPDCVIGEKDAVDENGTPKYQGIDTSFLVATLTAAIQEQQAMIQTLTSRIEALEQQQ